MSFQGISEYEHYLPTPACEKTWRYIAVDIAAVLRYIAVMLRPPDSVN